MILPIWSLWFISIAGAKSLSAEKVIPFCGIADCNFHGKSLHTFPLGLSDAVLGLDLAFNSIVHIQDVDLKFAVNLRTLLLQSNLIQTIDEHAFDFLGKLEHLDLSWNSLTYLSPSWFRNLSSLQKLNLKGNSYSKLGILPLFSGLQKLRYLYLGNDKFSSLQAKDFEGISVLEELEIEGHNLAQYSPGALQSLDHINHIILNVPVNLILNWILVDVKNSVVFLELRNAHNDRDSLTNYFKKVPITAQKLVFRHSFFLENHVTSLINALSGMTQLQELEIIDSTLQGTGQFNTRSHILSNLHIITIRNLKIELFYLFSDLSSMLYLVENVTRLTVENTKVFLVPCELAQKFISVQYLDINTNLLQDSFFEHSFCPGSWPKLQTLNVSQNSLTYLDRMARSVAHLVDLTNLDVSQNNLEQMPESCHWPKSLKYLNISGCKVEKLTGCIPDFLEILDASNNFLHDFKVSLPHLQELYLTNNRFKTLPHAAFIRHVRFVTIRENSVFVFSEQELQAFVELKSLDARNNSFQCTCGFVSFVQSYPRIYNICVGWPENYICDSPDYVKGDQIGVAQLQLIDCHFNSFVSILCILIILIILVSAFLCYKFHVIWYIRMTLAWLKAKRKPQRTHNQAVCYDAFVSYSEQDSEWVENIMVQMLEQSNPPFKLCLHKRDFMPGKWIVDNIIDSIEKSSKTLFVLSENFVRSEWCKYELDFSHFRFFDENNDTAILILLESIPIKTIPERFCKLRKLMNTKTYLEWPSDKDQEELFWFNLKLAIKA
ncbi:toll-like receptor 2 [Pseudonaja textilis]|uniref:toll-like receptor 2 n=1 Tax=Pseudonaja textilis TaxID=8673 RepID=UPI000EA96E27|nr:toll-like receptor 2 [Pseudonaja textilis]XP_026555723.1 toll-like receptor 2 [Pseudonaja textilis]XP_026555724.1 toll-like receptor 2 [Pseudonaja textilis]XP_026555725.1 toll-like receptor 2 [Pseudonaja textilis]